MKIITVILLFLLSFFAYFQEGFALSIFQDKSKIIYCSDGECSLDKWTELVKKGIDDIEKNRTASEYVQDVVLYLLTFITIIAVIYIIYAGFKILTSAGNDDEISKSKSTIVSVLIWIVIIWLSYTIVKWIIGVVMAT